MLPSPSSPIFSSSVSRLFIDFLALFYFNGYIILFYWNPFFGLYLWEQGTQDSMWNPDEIMPSYGKSNSREGNPGISLWDAGEQGSLVILVNLLPSKQPGPSYVLSTPFSNELPRNQQGLKAAAGDLGLSRLSAAGQYSNQRYWGSLGRARTCRPTGLPTEPKARQGWAGTWESVGSLHVWTFPECSWLGHGATGAWTRFGSWGSSRGCGDGGKGMSRSWIAGETLQKVCFWPQQGPYQNEIVTQHVNNTRWPLARVKSSVYRPPFVFFPQFIWNGGKG